MPRVGDEKPQYDTDPGVQKKGRRCQDIFWLLLFILFIGGMVAIGIVAIQKGDLNRLRYGYDSAGNLCGTNSGSTDMTSKPNLYYWNPANFSTPRQCVESCVDPISPIGLANIICAYGVTPGSDNSARLQQVATGKCFPMYSTTSVLNRCVPSDISAIIQALAFMNITVPASASNSSSSDALYQAVFVDLSARETVAIIFQDIQLTWKYILISAGVAIGISFVWLVIMQLFTSAFVWMTILAGQGLVTAIAGYLGWAYYQVYVQGRSWPIVGIAANDQLSYKVQDFVRSNVYNQNLLLALAIACAVVAFVLFFLLVWARKRIGLAVNLIQEAAKALRAVPMCLVWPVFKYILLVGICAWCIWIYALLSTSGDVIAVTAQDLASGVTKGYSKVFQPSTVLRWFEIYYVLGMFWLTYFVLAIGQITVAGAISTWYWTRDKSQLPTFTFLQSLSRCTRYSLGSAAIGSLVLALLSLVRLVLAKLYADAKKSQNKIAQYIVCCLQCCCAVIEKIVKVVNVRAYVEIAVYGKSYCVSAEAAWDLILRNAFRLVVVDGITALIVFLGKIAVASATTVFGVWILVRNSVGNSDVYAVPLLIIFISAYFIASGFFSVFDMTVDTLFVCFCEDSERNDGSSQRPYYMPASLKDFLNKHKKDQPVVGET
ncbi:hypothetical protein HDU93_007297 [Gonapodya sp. JEL0774]|nr:hypothetical protein HDU93_007297 [Gonapodya sp. JEL0774]